MNTSVVVAIITAIATLLAPILVRMTERDRREEIDKEIKILRQMNPESEGYKAFNAHVEKSLLDFAENDWLRSQYRNAYRRYIAFFLLLALLYLVNIWTASSEGSSWFVVYQIVVGILYLLAAALGGSILAPLIAALISEYEQIKVEWELKRKQFQVDQLEKIVGKMEGSRQAAEREILDLVRTHNMPENEEQEYAKMYNHALWWALRGTNRQKAGLAMAELPTLYGVEAAKVVNDAFDYFEEWSKKNESLKFIEIARDAS